MGKEIPSDENSLFTMLHTNLHVCSYVYMTKRSVWTAPYCAFQHHDRGQTKYSRYQLPVVPTPCFLNQKFASHSIKCGD